MGRWTYETGRVCPDCGEPEGWLMIPPFNCPLDLVKMQFSCPHFEERSSRPVCDYCGKPAEVRQVPDNAPVSTAYCDDPVCVSKCREDYK